MYYKVDRVIPRLLKERDYTIDEKAKHRHPDRGRRPARREALGVDNLYDPKYIGPAAPRQPGPEGAAVFKRDVDYVVKDGEVIIVDEFTGRLMFGRRCRDGLHQAIEAKEGVKIEHENQTLATITFQNYFRMYKKLGGMTGTAETEAEEFRKIYNLDVVVIPTNKPMIRTDFPDVIYKTGARSSRPWWTRSRSCTRGASPSWSAPSRSRSPSRSAHAQARRIPHTC